MLRHGWRRWDCVGSDHEPPWYLVGQGMTLPHLGMAIGRGDIIGRDVPCRYVKIGEGQGTTFPLLEVLSEWWYNRGIP